MKEELANAALERAHAYRITRVARLLRRSLIAVLAGVDASLSPEQFLLIMRLAEQDGVVQGELVDPDLDDRANITRQIDALARRDLVQRLPDSKDRRKRRIYLTHSGRDLYVLLLPLVRSERDQLFGVVPAADLAAFERVLHHLERVLV
ncbi:MAG: DNA-binding MarR family transcriptional regulator [Kiritimatiellia bacterium]|jgi:DNA-binding MarR family transcriptional regulator